MYCDIAKIEGHKRKHIFLPPYVCIKYVLLLIICRTDAEGEIVRQRKKTGTHCQTNQLIALRHF